MTLEWNDSLTVGHSLIDSQHKQLFTRVANLKEAIDKGEGTKELSMTVEFLEDYVREHFKTEEALMKKYKCPELLQHKEQHNEFISKYKEFKDELEENGPTPKLAIEIQGWLFLWVCDHIARTDKALGQFLKGKI